MTKMKICFHQYLIWNHHTLVPHICVGESGFLWFRIRLVACSAPNHCIVNCTLKNKFHWHFNRNLNIFLHENALENVMCEMAAILSRSLNMLSSTIFRYPSHNVVRHRHSYHLSHLKIPILHPIPTDSLRICINMHHWIKTKTCLM